MNSIFSHKNRKIDFSKKVSIYRNLHAKTDAQKYSIKQNGLVAGHTNCLLMQDCQFIVNTKGRERVLRTNRKTVHAFIRGKITDSIVYFGVKLQPYQFCSFIGLSGYVSYNPYKNKSFIYNGVSSSVEIKRANYVAITGAGIFAEKTA